MPFGVPMRYGGARAVQRAAPWVSPEEEQSLLSDIASKTFSTAGWIGGTLDARRRGLGYLQADPPWP